MKCPECGSEERIKDSGEIYCKKCGLELEDAVIYRKGRGSRKDAEKPKAMPELNVISDPKKEFYALKLGLKYNKLRKGWENELGFKLQSEYLKPELKEKAKLLIEKSHIKHTEALLEAQERITRNWELIGKKFFLRINEIFHYDWQSNIYLCYLSMCINGGFHNSSKNFIIIRYDLDKLAGYVISTELFHIIFREYVTRYFKEPFSEADNDLSEAMVHMVLLTDPFLKTLYPKIKFSPEQYKNVNHKEIISKIYPAWNDRESFKEFIIKSFQLLKIEKTWISY